MLWQVRLNSLCRSGANFVKLWKGSRIFVLDRSENPLSRKCEFYGWSVPKFTTRNLASLFCLSSVKPGWTLTYMIFAWCHRSRRGWRLAAAAGTSKVLACIFSKPKYGISDSDGLFVRADCCSGKLDYILMLIRRQMGWKWYRGLYFVTTSVHLHVLYWMSRFQWKGSCSVCNQTTQQCQRQWQPNIPV